MWTGLLRLFGNADPSCVHTFLGLIPWYQYLSTSPKAQGCEVNIPDGSILGAHSAFLLIGLAVLEDLIRIAALVAVGFVIYGAVQYVTSQGAPEETSKARSTIINALVGVLIAVIAAGVVSYIGTKLGNIS